MTQTALPRSSETSTRPRAWRRAVVAVTGVVGCLLPAVWTVNFIRMLATGELAEHRFHQLTGQGLLLTALWLGGLVPLVLAGWRGRRPGVAPALLHLSFVGVGIGCSLVAPQGGARSLMVLITVTGALVWLALPQRPRLHRARVELAPASLAAALLTSAAVAPYAVAQIGLQHVATGHHAHNPHYFDMAWLVMVLAVIGLLGAVLRDARGLQLWAGAGTAATGVAMLALGEGTVRGAVLAAAGALLVGAWTLVRRGASSPIAGHDSGA